MDQEQISFWRETLALLSFVSWSSRQLVHPSSRYTPSFQQPLNPLQFSHFVRTLLSTSLQPSFSHTISGSSQNLSLIIQTYDCLRCR
ncbi:hypothetical protein FGO68_gene5452 [Halteria grandinella]|uniref:Uncharacterized protein n=1 Tax=Halteria grandinella TaxID=5974 RepID=A0A8J8SZU4_HALGN|nr:hypothetical protein FGO68_gene5452 [Halteria grandinella]